MKKTGIIKAIRLVSAYKKMNIDERELLRKQRMRELIKYVSENSPYFAGLREDSSLSELPVTNKVDMMKNFDNWITDRSVKLSEINKFMENLDNIGRPFMDKYQVYTTSGSTGNPAVILYDKNAVNITGALGFMRGYARKEDMWAFIKKGGKSIGVYATGGFFMGNSSIRSKQLEMPRKAKQVRISSILNPIPDIVKELNEFQPAMLGGYPTALSLLAEEQRSGRLNISPVIVMAGGEYMGDDVRNELTAAFKCYVQSNYSCTEGSVVACECVHKHYHINDDWIIMEPVDEKNRSVPFGKKADKWLLTNLSNYIQPIIRYEVSDKIIMHDEGCPCGNPSPWVEVEGRTDDILNFKNKNGIVKILPLSLYALMKGIPEINRFQLALHAGNHLELRLMSNDIDAAFNKAKKILNEYLNNYKISAEIYLSDIPPQPNPKSGKFKHVYMEG